MTFITSFPGQKPGQKEWTCYRILHDGEGPRGEKVTVMTPHYANPEEAACLAADYFDDAEQLKERSQDNNDQFDGTEQVIEVCSTEDCHGKGYKLRTHCTVQRKYMVVIR